MTARTKKIIIAVTVTVVIGALFFIGVMTGAAVVGWRAATRAGNEAATIQNLKTIAVVEVEYFNTHKRTFGTFDQLRGEQFLGQKFANYPSAVDGYVFTLSVTRKSDGSSWYKITADRQEESQGTNHFYLDSDNAGIRFNSERRAGPGDPFL